jgi:hypothetical protein
MTAKEIAPTLDLKWIRDEDGARADLRGAYLQGADLRGAYLQRADLQRAYLRDAYLRDANLRCTDLRDAKYASSVIVAHLAGSAAEYFWYALLMRDGALIFRAGCEEHSVQDWMRDAKRIIAIHHPDPDDVNQLAAMTLAYLNLAEVALRKTERGPRVAP